MFVVLINKGKYKIKTNVTSTSLGSVKNIISLGPIHILRGKLFSNSKLFSYILLKMAVKQKKTQNDKVYIYIYIYDWVQTGVIDDGKKLVLNNFFFLEFIVNRQMGLGNEKNFPVSFNMLIDVFGDKNDKINRLEEINSSYPKYI